MSGGLVMIRGFFFCFVVLAGCLTLIERGAAQPVKEAGAGSYPELQKAADALNQVYRDLAEAKCGIRTTNIPPQAEIDADEEEFRRQAFGVASDLPHVKQAMDEAFKLPIPSEAHTRAVARADGMRKEMETRIRKQLINDNPKVQCPPKVKPAKLQLDPGDFAPMKLEPISAPNPQGVQLSVGIEGGFASAVSNFAGTSFEVPMNGFVGGAFFDARIFTAANYFGGLRIGGQAGNLNGVGLNLGLDHTVDVDGMAYLDLYVGARMGGAPGVYVGGIPVSVSVGPAIVHRTLTLSNGAGFTTSERALAPAVTGAIRVDIPTGSNIVLNATLRGTHVVESQFFGGIRVSTDVLSATVGVAVILD
jgi:hypothetical protein